MSGARSFLFLVKWSHLHLPWGSRAPVQVFWLCCPSVPPRPPAQGPSLRFGQAGQTRGTCVWRLVWGWSRRLSSSGGRAVAPGCRAGRAASRGPLPVTASGAAHALLSRSSFLRTDSGRGLLFLALPRVARREGALVQHRPEQEFPLGRILLLAQSKELLSAAPAPQGAWRLPWRQHQHFFPCRAGLPGPESVPGENTTQYLSPSFSSVLVI